MVSNEYLSVQNLSFSYDKKSPILQNVNTSFSKGKITALIGANGCGKSTLLNLIAGIMNADSGVILLDGKSINDYKRNVLAKKVAVVHQSNTAPSDITVRKLVEAGRTPYKTLFGKNNAEDDAAVDQALLDTETKHLAERTISSLSGGQLQRVWLAMALAQDTKILLLDEITTYLDIHYQLEIMHLVRNLNRKKGITVIMVLHDINLALEFCNEAVIMKEGKIISQGTVRQSVTKDVLNEAFSVSSDIITTANGRQHCVFSRKGELYG